MSTSLLHEFAPKDANVIASLESYVNHFNVCVDKRIVLPMGDESLESLFSVFGEKISSIYVNLKNKIQYGSGFGKVEQLDLNPVILTTLKQLNYSNVKTKPIPVAPGFNDNLLSFFVTLESRLKDLQSLESDLKHLNSVCANILNGSDILQSPTGIKTLDTLTKRKPFENTLSSSYTNKLVDEALFGKVFKNVKELEISLENYKRLVTLNNSINYVEIGHLTESFNEYVGNLNNRDNKGEVNTKAVKSLIEVMLDHARRIDESVTIQMTMTEWSVALPKMVDCLTIQQ